MADDSQELYERARQRMDAGALDEAVTFFRASAEKDVHFKTYELLGECLARLGRYTEAVMPLAAATALNRQSRAPTLLAEVFLALEQYDDAWNLAFEALERAPDNRRAAAAQRKAKAALRARQPNSFELAEALYYLGALEPEDLEGFVPNHESLADRDAAKRAFEPLLAGRPPLDIETAWKRATMEVVRAIHEERTYPQAGAALIASKVYFSAGAPDALSPFYTIDMDWEDATEYDDWLARRAEIEARIRDEVDRWIASDGPPPPTYVPLGQYDYQEPPAGPAVQLYWDGREGATERLTTLIDRARRAGWRVYGTRLLEFNNPRPEWNVAGAYIVLARGTTDAEAEDFLLWAEQSGTRRGVVIRRADTIYEQRPT